MERAALKFLEFIEEDRVSLRFQDRFIKKRERITLKFKAIPLLSFFILLESLNSEQFPCPPTNILIIRFYFRSEILNYSNNFLKISFLNNIKPILALQDTNLKEDLKKESVALKFELFYWFSKLLF